MSLPFAAVVASRRALHVLQAASGRGGEVQSTYRHTINVRFAGDRLVCLHNGRELIAPFGIALGQPSCWPALKRIGEGTPVETMDGMLRIAAAGIEVATDGASIWEPKTLPTALDPAAARRQAEILAGVLREHDNPDGLAPLVDAADTTPLLRRARWSVTALQEGLARREPALVVAGAEPLLGLGPGLTPAGDDFLAGILGTAMLASPSILAIIRDVAGPLLRLARERTTLVSHAFLAEALCGVLAPPVDAVAAAILADAEPDILADAALHAAALGHTSGLDTLAGAVFALRAVAEATT